MLQVMPGGHCFYCHEDYTEYREQHPCFGKPYDENKKSTPCDVMFGRDCQYKPKGYYVEHWSSDCSNREDHYFVGNRDYVWGFNPKYVSKELAAQIFELIKPHIK